MKIILLTVLMQGVGNDPNWSAFWEWLTGGNYFVALLVLAGLAGLALIVAFVWRGVVTMGVAAFLTALAIVAAVVPIVIYWGQNYFIPTGVNLGPGTFNIVTQKVGEIDQLYMPGEDQPDQPGPNPTQSPDQQDVRDAYTLDEDATIRSGPAGSYPKLGPDIPSGTEVCVIDWDDGDDYCEQGVCRRAKVEPIGDPLAFGTGWVHEATLDNYQGTCP